METIARVRRGVRASLARAALGLAVLGGAVHAQKDGMEEFEEVDPYTKGDPELMKRLGYVTYGPFAWRGGDSTAAVAEVMGGVPSLWVETEHFRIGSTLPTYRMPGDKEEKERIEEELERLEEKLGKLKAPKNELDPWLRLHLYAQRAEEVYRWFHEDFGLTPNDYAAQGPYLGQPAKPLVLLCERKSEFQRHLRQYVGADHEASFRWGWPEGGMFFGANVEAIRERWDDPGGQPMDAMLHCTVASNLANLFVDGYRRSYFGAPCWLGVALGHLYVRRIDPRWMVATGTKEGRRIRDKDHEWERRVSNLLSNDFYATTEAMFGWRQYADLDVRDHMVAWSRLDYLLNEAEGDAKGFLADLCQPRPRGQPADVDAALLARQTTALGARYGLTPAELDEAWAKWAEKAYRKRR